LGHDSASDLNAHVGLGRHAATLGHSNKTVPVTAARLTARHAGKDES
jgi:hypothetical protein